MVSGIPDPITIVGAGTSVVPKNSAEYATYTFTLQTAHAFVANEAVKIIFSFPADYPDNLIAEDLSLYCDSEPPTEFCYTTDTRQVIFENVLTPTLTNADLVFTIFGITNPSVLSPFTTGNVVVDMVAQNKEVIASGGSGIAFTLTAPPKMLNMSLVYADDLRSDALTDYTFGFKTLSQDIPAGGVVWIDWPSEYDGLFSTTGQSCTFTSDVSIGSASCQQQDTTGRKRTEVTGINTLVTAPSSEIQIGLTNAPTPEIGGESDNYTLRTYDPATQVVLERSYPGASGATSLTFVEGDKAVDLPNAETIEVFAGCYSEPVEIKLQ